MIAVGDRDHCGLRIRNRRLAVTEYVARHGSTLPELATFVERLSFPLDGRAGNRPDDGSRRGGAGIPGILRRRHVHAGSEQCLPWLPAGDSGKSGTRRRLSHPVDSDTTPGRLHQGPQDAWTHYGFVTYHVLHLNPKGNAFEAIVCGGEYSHFVNSLAQPGKFVSVAVNEATGKPYTSGSGLSVHRIEFTQSDSRVGANPPAPVAAPQRGPAPAPDQDVLGNWFITAASSHYWGPINDPQSRNFPTPDLERQCAERMPQNEAERTAMMSGFKDEPPPPGQAEPGLASQSQLSSSMPMCTA
jgi:hypothetical protein